jgi:hypothetical protein
MVNLKKTVDNVMQGRNILRRMAFINTGTEYLNILVVGKI